MIDWMKRFSRQEKIFNQKKIRNTNAIIVGAGGLGSLTAIQLAMLGIRKMVLVDMDTVDDSNLNRQYFYEEDIDKPKVDALAEKLKQINSKLKIEQYERRIEDVPKMAYENIHYIFDCLDNIETREMLNRFCVENNIKLVHAGCSPNIGEVQIIIPHKTACLACIPYPKEMRQDERSCADFDPAICTTNFIVSSLQVEMFLNDLHKKVKDKTAISYIRNKGVSFQQLPINKKCKVCFGNKTLTKN